MVCLSLIYESLLTDFTHVITSNSVDTSYTHAHIYGIHVIMLQIYLAKLKNNNDVSHCKKIVLGFCDM